MDLFDNEDELKELMDKVILKTLELVEEDVTLKINIEKLTNQGALLMAKTRFVQGQNAVSISKLPAESEDAREFKPLKTICTKRNKGGVIEFELETTEVDKDTGHMDPINWFGILVPQALRTARDRYSKSIELVIESANVEQQLRRNYQLLGKLRSIKQEFENTRE